MATMANGRMSPATILNLEHLSYMYLYLYRFDTIMDKNTGYFYLFYCSNRWLAVRLDMMSSCVVCITGLCVVLTYDNLTPAMAGLALSFAIQVNMFDVLTEHK